LKLMLQHRASALSPAEFSLVISLFCSGKVMNRKFLFRDLTILEKCIQSETSLRSYFESNFETLVDKSLYAKTGILSRDVE